MKSQKVSDKLYDWAITDFVCSEGKWRIGVSVEKTPGEELLEVYIPLELVKMKSKRKDLKDCVDRLVNMVLEPKKVRLRAI